MYKVLFNTNYSSPKTRYTYCIPLSSSIVKYLSKIVKNKGYPE